MSHFVDYRLLKIQSDSQSGQPFYWVDVQWPDGRRDQGYLPESTVEAILPYIQIDHSVQIPYSLRNASIIPGNAIPADIYLVK
jgi:hypothetical protein